MQILLDAERPVETNKLGETLYKFPNGLHVFLYVYLLYKNTYSNISIKIGWQIILPNYSIPNVQ